MSPANGPAEGANDELDDVKAKMREALERKKKKNQSGDADGAPLREKAHGSEVYGGAKQKMHRRKAGG